jgi:hypothetical protein
MDLERYGFVRVGAWVLHEKVKSGIKFELERWGDRRVVYAFVVGTEVKYIGVCEKDTTTLHDRMNRYKSMVGGSTNRHNAGRIKQHLEAGEPVSIFALCPEPDCRFFDLTVDLVKGLENPLIKRFKPEWNR